MKSYTSTIKKFEKEKPKKRFLRDVGKWYSDKKALKRLIDSGKDKNVVYETFTISYSPMMLTLTNVYPGKIGKEFYMTKGHVHGKKVPEFYILLEGKGKLLIQKGKPKVIDLKKGELVEIPIGYGHRLVNTGKKKMKVLTIYHEDSRPNYNIKFKKRFLGR